MSHEDTMWVYWEMYSTKECPDMFEDDGVQIANDGGVSDIRFLDYYYQYYKSGSILVHSAMNMYVMSFTDIHAIFHKNQQMEKSFLLSRYICSTISTDYEFSLPYDKLVPIMEMIVLFILLGKIILNLILVACPNKSSEHWEMLKWARLSSLMHKQIPGIARFSALRMLYYVTPTVLMSQYYQELYICNENYANATSNVGRFRAVSPLFRSVIITVIYLIFGFDAFLVKYRMASGYIMETRVTVTTLMGAFVFLLQILGVVNLRSFVKDRLFLFIFAGEDGNLNIHEKSRWEVWLCILTKRIFAEFGLFKGLVVMLGFDDYDFQRLVLDPAKKET